MFGFNWLKPILKKRMRPVPQHRAKKAVNNLAVTYAFLGWNFVTLCLYFTWKQNIPEGPQKIKKYAEILGANQAHVIRYSGLQKIDEYDLEATGEIKKNSKECYELRRKVTDLDSQPTQELESENITQELSKSI